MSLQTLKARDMDRNVNYLLSSFLGAFRETRLQLLRDSFSRRYPLSCFTTFFKKKKRQLSPVHGNLSRVHIRWCHRQWPHQHLPADGMYCRRKRRVQGVGISHTIGYNQAHTHTHTNSETHSLKYTQRCAQNTCMVYGISALGESYIKSHSQHHSWCMGPNLYLHVYIRNHPGSTTGYNRTEPAI